MTNQPISNEVIAASSASASDELKYMCRICGESDISIQIYSNLGKLMNLEEKICKGLRLELKENSLQPNNVCMKCVGRVNLVYEIHELTAATQDRIATILAASKNATNGPTDSQCSASWQIAEAHSLHSEFPNKPPNQVDEINSASSPGVSGPLGQPSGVKRPIELPPVNGISPVKKKDRKTVCIACGQWFFKNEMAAHTAHFHPTNKSVFACVNCSSNFATSEELAAHEGSCSITLDS
ncbi:Zinc-finger associated domain (zf-AD) [Nesidiocoris tenuis]|uniref:Zinc-finger associated domain (Zf-AD) n=1 Tax=Nesidiocoris tenuis TaxID=355587 RepID=A0ABN7APU7_9HEMI|nr:Zinc-finger associated domain (zf-AD) [Nesidiocoris tenuis]